MPGLARLEPAGLVGHFLDHPPEDFSAWVSEAGVPMFAARFDLLTTADADARRRVAGLPGYARWRGLLRPWTTFVGTTVSEYALLDDRLPPAEWARGLRDAYGRRHPLLIVKDLPQASPLLPAADNDYAAEAAGACEALGFVLVEGQALAYVPIDFASIDAYLERISYSRRKNLRRKLKSRKDLEIEQVPTGDARFDDPAVLRAFYDLYLGVFAQSEIHFDKLTEPFFSAMLRDAGSGGIVFVYRLAGRMVGYNVCFEHGGKLIDKYVGFQYPDARDCNLYFVSWFVNLEYALARGLSHYVAGWTDPEVKAYLGASFTFTRHAVYIRNPLLRAVLRRFAHRFESDRTWHEGEA